MIFPWIENIENKSSKLLLTRRPWVFPSNGASKIKVKQWKNSCKMEDCVILEKRFLTIYRTKTWRNVSSYQSHGIPSWLFLCFGNSVGSENLIWFWHKIGLSHDGKTTLSFIHKNLCASIIRNGKTSVTTWRTTKVLPISNCLWPL